jgi:hypothetical protein
VEKVTSIADVQSVLEGVEGIKVVAVEDSIIVVEYEGIPVSLVLTDEDPARLRLSIDVGRLDAIDEDTADEIMYQLLDMNTEIDPVAAAIDSTDPDNIMIQARTTLRVVDLQPDEVVEEFNGIIGALASIHEVVASKVTA